MKKARHELIQIQKRLVDDLKARIYETWDRDDPELDRYYRAYQAEFKHGIQRNASQREIVQQLERAHIAYFGDFHTLRQAQSGVLGLLDQLSRQTGKRIVLAVEMLHAAHKAHAQDLIDRAIRPDDFRESVDWNRTWGFSWASFGRFFQFARDHNAPLFGININADYRDGGLKYRDHFGGDLVAALTHLYPERLVAVVYGDLHLAEGHLPRQVQKRLDRYGADRRSVRIYQNSETIYWDLVSRHLENVVDAVRIRKDVYCVMNATPMVKFQSLANWQAHNEELWFHGIADFDSMLPGDSLVLEQVQGFIGTICGFLEIELDQPDNFELYTSADLDFLSNLVARNIYSSDEQEVLKDYMLMADSAYFERARVLYLGNLSVANAAEAGARYVLAELRPNPRTGVEERDEFYARVIIESLAFFCSRIIHPARKTRGVEGWQDVVAKFARKRRLSNAQRTHLAVARAFIKHHEWVQRARKKGNLRGAPRSLFRLPTTVHLGVTRALGRELGAALFAATESDRIDKSDIRDLMREDIFAPHRSRKIYFDVLSRVK